MSFIDDLECEWSDTGFLGRLRSGKFFLDEAGRFLSVLAGIEILDDETVPKRAISLLWYIPSFLHWQRERVMEEGGDMKGYDHFVTEVHNVLEDVLGVP